MACALRCGVEPAGACLIAVACGHHLRRGTGWAGSYLVCSEVCVVRSMQLVFGSPVTGLEKDHDQTGLTEKDCKLSGPTKTITTVRSTVLYRFQTFKTEQKPVLTG